MLKLYAHPFSSYSQKVLVALYENDTGFEYRNLENAEAGQELARLSPVGRFPVLVDGERVVFESTAIIEHLQARHTGAVRLIPAAEDAAIEARMLDRFFDNYVMTPMQKLVLDHLRPAESRDAYGAGEAHALLDKAYAWLDGWLEGRLWAQGDTFSLADCAAAPSLFYADWVHPVPEQHANVRTYRQRLLARPSFARAVEEARPFRDYFPPGAPDRD